MSLLGVGIGVWIVIAVIKIHDDAGWAAEPHRHRWYALWVVILAGIVVVNLWLAK